MVPLADMPHFRSVNSAHFSPTGEWVATVGQDDKIKLYKDLAKTTGGKVQCELLKFVLWVGSWTEEEATNISRVLTRYFVSAGASVFPICLHVVRCVVLRCASCRSGRRR